MHKLVIGEFIDTMANIEYGILIAIVLDAILLFVIASINSKQKLSVLSYLIAAALLIPLTFQMSRLIGACQISDNSSVINAIVGTVSPTLNKYVASATSSDIGWFVFRRILWSVIFMGVAGLGIYVTMDMTARNPRKRARSTRHRSGRSYDNNF